MLAQLDNQVLAAGCLEESPLGSFGIMVWSSIKPSNSVTWLRSIISASAGMRIDDLIQPIGSRWIKMIWFVSTIPLITPKKLPALMAYTVDCPCTEVDHKQNPRANRIIFLIMRIALNESRY